MATALLALRLATCVYKLVPISVSTSATAWLRLKGKRDIVSGFVVLATLARADPRVLGIILFVEAFIPIGDMSLVLAADGSRARAFGIHGLTAVVMIAGALPLVF